MYNDDKTMIPVGPNGVELDNVDAMFRFARCYIQSGLAPSSIKNEQQLVIIWAKARELGLSPLQAVEGMAVINNRVGLGGDLALAMVEASGLLEQKKVEYSGEGETLACTVTLKRKGRDAQSYSFSVKEARNAKIYERSTPWQQYPKRMTYYRALGFGLRDEFADVLKGTKTVEELQDYPEERAERPVYRMPTRPPKPEPVIEPEPAKASESAPPAKAEQQPFEREILAKIKKMLEVLRIEESELIAVLRLAHIPEAQGAKSLTEIPDKALIPALEDQDTLLELVEQYRKNNS